MQAKYKQVLESYERAQGFLAANPLPNPPVRYAEQKAELDSVVVRLHVQLGEQAAGQKESRDGTARQAALRQQLREEHLAPVARIAQALLTADPQVRRALAMPAKKLSSMRLVAEGTGFRSSAAVHEQLFIESGRPADFLARLDLAIAALHESVQERARSVARHVGATAAVQEAVVRGRRAMRMLDAMVQDAFRGNAEVLAKWRQAKRVQVPPGSGGGARALVPAEEGVGDSATSPIAA